MAVFDQYFSDKQNIRWQNLMEIYTTAKFDRSLDLSRDIVSTDKKKKKKKKKKE